LPAKYLIDWNPQLYLFQLQFDFEFWHFSVNEMGLYDLPAKIDYILRVTKNEQLNYIGHSMGCAGFYIMMSKMPEYNSRIRQMQSLAPVVYGQGLRTPLKLLFPFLRNYQSVRFFHQSKHVFSGFQ
jgi:triacylglycerol esterase/lipase EstA (alpha/beta hydrolase family)